LFRILQRVCDAGKNLGTGLGVRAWHRPDDERVRARHHGRLNAIRTIAAISSNALYAERPFRVALQNIS
jgi:hypothetical protein